MDGSTSKDSRFPLQKSLSRRVSFNESSIANRRHDDSDTESQIDDNSRRRICGSIDNSIFIWISLILGILLILLILIGGIYYAFLQSNMPEVRLARLDIKQISYNTTNKATLLTANFTVFLNTTNTNSKIELVYRSMKASVSSTGIDFGGVKLADMRQPPQNSTRLILRAVIKSVAVEDASAKELQDDAKRDMLEISVVVRGKIDFFLGGKKMNGFPFKIECRSIDQSEIDNGRQPKCNAKLTPLH